MRTDPLFSRRKTYTGRRIKIVKDPLALFHEWFEEAARAVPEEPNAAALATASKDGAPSVRMILLKEYGPEGFTFFTSFKSKKGRELSRNPKCSLCFYWPLLHHQVRIEGTAHPLPGEYADRYFSSRPKGSKIAAAISRQSSVLDSYARLLGEFRARELSGAEPARPRTWGGFRIIPRRMEFWSGMPNRLHERVEYRKRAKGWITRRLYP